MIVKINAMNFLVRLLISAAIAYGLSMILSGVHINGFGTAIVFALVLAFLNAFVKPLLVLFTLPVTILTLGLFLFVINAVIIVIADKLLDGLKVDSFLWALLFSLILSIFSSAASTAMQKDEDR